MRRHGYWDAGEFLGCNMSPKKGRKVGKAQRAKQQQEEEERKLREEEEARLQAEREEQEQLDKERKEKELEELELKDSERRAQELDELRHLLEDNHTAATKWKSDAAEKAKWERYMRCDGSPDPADQREINTYMGLWRDDPEVNMAGVLTQCRLALQLMEELEGLLRDATDSEERHKQQEALTDLQELIHHKLLLSTEEILKGANANVDTETGNMQTEIKDDNVTLCLWANLKKNPRLKGIHFEEGGVSLELPKPLAVSDVAVRSLHTRYDHLSLLARMAHLKTHTHSHRSLTAGGDQDQDQEQDQLEETTEEEEALQLQSGDEEVQSVHSSEGTSRKSVCESVSSLQSRSSLHPGQAPGSRIRTQMEALSAEGDLSSPALLADADPPAMARPVDLMQYTPLGGVFYCDLFQLPPQARQAGGWEIRQVLSKGLQVSQYPTADEAETHSCPPLGVSVRLPDLVVFLEPPQVARWDAAGKQWRMDGISDMSFEEAEAKVSFKMDSFHTFALMQETYANFPFQSWELRPLGPDCALLTINGALTQLSITIQGNECMLRSEALRGLSHLQDKWTSAWVLQRAMIQAGVNVFVNEHSHKYVSTCTKDPLAEHAAYEQMALLASACAFSWSKWNAKCGAQHLVVQVCEHLGCGPVTSGPSDPSPVPRESWRLYLLGAQRSQKLEMSECSEAFSADHCSGSELHSTFIHMLRDSMSAEAVARSGAAHHLFVDTVQNLLCATRPLVFS